MTSPDGKMPVTAPSAVPASESNRTKSIATRLTDAEFAEIESAAASAGKKVAEWLREAALAQAAPQVKRRQRTLFCWRK